MNKQEYDAGYNEAIKAIQKAMAGQQGGGGGTSMPQPDNDVDLEDIKDLLPPPPEGGDGGDGTGEGKEKDGEDDGEGGGNSSKNDENNKQGKGKGKGKGEGKDGEDSGEGEGEGGDGNEDGEGGSKTVDPYEMDNETGEQTNTPDPGGYIDKATGDDICKKEGYKPTAGNDDSVAKDWQEKAIKNASKMKGNDPGNFLSRLTAIYKTKTDWKNVLKKIVGRSISDDEHEEWRYFNKKRLVTNNEIRRADRDTERDDALGYIAVFIDSSGSMSDDQLRKCLAEVYTLALQKKPLKLVIVQCDTEIQEIKEYHSVKEMEKDFKQATVKGRGGTELKPCWDWLENDKKNKNRKCELVMVFTDGYLEQYKRIKKMNWLYWIILDNPSCDLEYPDRNTGIIHFNQKDIQ